MKKPPQEHHLLTRTCLITFTQLSDYTGLSYAGTVRAEQLLLFAQSPVVFPQVFADRAGSSDATAEDFSYFKSILDEPEKYLTNPC